ncbi:MAG TPA: hypothetical protein VNZ06_04235, partial [Steroidobacteraceae bacterium]|nr:hypothetical protein [Steroidobacteraceae bacterium]
SQQGVTDSTGKTILPPEAIGTGGVAAQALGFQPSVVTEFREGRNAALEAREEAQSARSSLVNRYLAATPIDRHAIQSEINQFNADPMHRGMAITVDQLLRDEASRRKQAREPFGLKLPAKAARTLGQAGAFANVPQSAQIGAAAPP